MLELCLVGRLPDVEREIAMGGECDVTVIMTHYVTIKFSNNSKKINSQVSIILLKEEGKYEVIYGMNIFLICYSNVKLKLASLHPIFIRRTKGITSFKF